MMTLDLSIEIILIVYDSSLLAILSIQNINGLIFLMKCFGHCQAHVAHLITAVIFYFENHDQLQIYSREDQRSNMICEICHYYSMLLMHMLLMESHTVSWVWTESLYGLSSSSIHLSIHPSFPSLCDSPEAVEFIKIDSASL